MADGGVDGFIIETMTDLKEALTALRACKDVSSLPVIVSMSFASTKNGGRTIMGNSAYECAKEITDAGAQVVGANCGNIDPLQMSKIILTISNATQLPILAQPNAGKPKLVDKKTIFDMPPPEFSKGIKECIHAGAKIVGGCCGTSPEHIYALARDIINK